MEKNLGPYSVINLGNILETAIQRGPMLHIQNKRMDRAIHQYRSFMNALETNSTHNIRQTIARQLAEVMLRGVSSLEWPRFDTSLTTSSGPWKPQRYLGQSLFYPKEREEELMLLLLIAESLASKNVVLDRSTEFEESRTRSLEQVTTIYDLMSITLVPLGHFYTDCYER